ncbi:MAG: hypothetical protein IPL61_25685 [Myxococcales bacterium]|nr:hypothetical protein [Myxococcales bacterium]
MTGDVAWMLFGRRGTPAPGDTTSSTLRIADQWLCAPAQLCPGTVAYDGAFRDLLAAVAHQPGGLGLSTASLARADVRAVELVDRAAHTRFDGRRVLWLYLAARRAHPLPAATCRFLDAVLADDVAATLTAAGRAAPLPRGARARQRAWLGLDDGGCAHRPTQALLDDDDATMARTPIASEIEPTPWAPVPDAAPAQ